eukprot:gene4915-3527_t
MEAVRQKQHTHKQKKRAWADVGRKAIAYIQESEKIIGGKENVEKPGDTPTLHACKSFIFEQIREMLICKLEIDNPGHIAEHEDTEANVS